MLNNLVKDFKANIPINMLANKYKMPGYLVIATLGALTLDDKK